MKVEAQYLSAYCGEIMKIEVYPEELWHLEPYRRYADTLFSEHDGYAVLGAFNDLGIIGWIYMTNAQVAAILWPA